MANDIQASKFRVQIEKEYNEKHRNKETVWYALYTKEQTAEKMRKLKELCNVWNKDKKKD